MNQRVFQHSRGSSRNEARELLQVFFAAELLDPSPILYVVSPWLRNVDIYDNQSGAFEGLIPGAPRRQLRLVDILCRMLESGSKVVLVIRTPRDDGGVAYAVEEWAKIHEHLPTLRIVERAELHTKAILSARAALTGSMNVTHAGLEKNMELLHFDTDEELLARLSFAFAADYGN
mgnify:CR=1 FL=1